MIRVQEQAFDAGAELAKLKAGNTAIGGTVMFLGSVRDLSDGADVRAMTLEHYAGMTEKALADIEAEAQRRWPSMPASSSTATGGLNRATTSYWSSLRPRIAKRRLPHVISSSTGSRPRRPSGSSRKAARVLNGWRPRTATTRRRRAGEPPEV